MTVHIYKTFPLINIVYYRNIMVWYTKAHKMMWNAIVFQYIYILPNTTSHWWLHSNLVFRVVILIQSVKWMIDCIFKLTFLWIFSRFIFLLSYPMCSILDRDRYFYLFQIWIWHYYRISLCNVFRPKAIWHLANAALNDSIQSP